MEKGFDTLKLEKDVKLPELGDHDCLVQIQAVSLNYRDLIIPQVRNPVSLGVLELHQLVPVLKLLSVTKDRMLILMR